MSKKSKSCDEAAKVLSFSGVGPRTRSFTRLHNLEAAVGPSQAAVVNGRESTLPPPRRGRGRPRKQPKYCTCPFETITINTIGPRTRSSTRLQNLEAAKNVVDKTVVNGGESTLPPPPRRGRGRPRKIPNTVNGGTNNNKDTDSDRIERISEAEFERVKNQSLSNAGPSAPPRGRGRPRKQPKYCTNTNDDTDSDGIERITEAEFNRITKPSLPKSGPSAPRGRGRPKKTATPIEPKPIVVGLGNTKKDLRSEEMEIGNLKKKSLSKMGASTGKELDQAQSTAIGRNSGKSSRKVISSVDDLRKGKNIHGHMEAEDGSDSEIEIINETEFRKQMQSKSRIGPSSKQDLNDVQSGAVPDDTSDDSSYQGDDSEDTNSDENMIDRIDETKFRKNSRSVSKVGPSKGQELDGDDYAATTSRRKSVDSLSKQIPFADISGSNQGQPDNSESCVQRGGVNDDMLCACNNNEYNTCSKDIRIAPIDESEFTGVAISAFASNLGPSTERSISSEDVAGSNPVMGQTDQSSSFAQQARSSEEQKKENKEEWNGNVVGDNDGHTSSDDSIYWMNCNSEVNDEIRSNSAAGHDIDPSIASQSRVTKQAPEVESFRGDTSTSCSDSDSSPNGEDCGVERLHFSDKNMKAALGPRFVEKCDEQDNNKLMEVSPEEIGNLSEQKESPVKKRAIKKRRLSELQDEEKDIDQPSASVKFGLRNKKFKRNNASTKKNKGRKTRKVNEVHVEENEESNKIPDNDDIQKIFGSSSSDTETEKISVDEYQIEEEEPTSERKQSDLCKMLSDSVLEKGPMLKQDETKESNEQAAPPVVSQSLPLKFRFEDDDEPKVVEKTEYEKEMEMLFAEWDDMWALSELGSSSNYPDEENLQENDQENKKCLAAEGTPHDRCVRGDHELVLRDDKGLICIYCGHVELGARDIMPEWADNPYRESKRKRNPERDHLPDLSDFHVQSLADNNNDTTDFRNNPTGTVWNVKPGVRESMYEHQQEGFEFLWKNLAGGININNCTTDPDAVGGCIISHAPGTGKTRLTIIFVETYLKLFPNCRPVIIAPASMLLTWEEEFRKWNVDFPFFNLGNPDFTGKENKDALELVVGSKRGNQNTIRLVKIYSWNIVPSILGISYSLFEKLTGEKYIKGENAEKDESVILDEKVKAMRKILLEKPGLVILDEGHTPRNKRSNIWNAILKLRTEKRVILSGTPFQNNFEELFNMLRIVRPAIAEVLVQNPMFAEMINSKRKKSRRGRNGQSTEVTDHAVEKLKRSMSPFVHVHKGTILQKSLPGLIDCVVLLKPQPLQKSLIERLEGSPSTFQFEHKVALLSVHPYLFKYCDSTKEQRIGIDLPAVKASKLNFQLGAKTNFIVELIRYSMVFNEKVLIFSQYIQPLKLLTAQIKKIFKWAVGKQILRMEGKLEQKQRQFLINIFNDPLNESKVMLASTKCCSEGISLVGASRVVLLDVVWNPSVERQAICRAYRIGQKKFVYTYHLMTSGTTEADKYCRQADKDRLSELVFTSSSNETNNKDKHQSTDFEDRILEEMVGHAKLKGMFEKIIHQPKDKDLIQSFGLTSS